MPFHMQCKVVRPREGALAEMALERTVSGVFTEMAGQLIRPGEFPAASFPATVVWLLTCMRPVVRFQVRALGVSFAASFERADMARRPLSWPSASSSLGLCVHDVERG